MYKNYNPNPCGKKVGDCVIRAISKILDQSWEKTYLDLCIYGLNMCDMPSSNSVWGRYLKDKGFNQRPLDFMTVEEFARNNPTGKFILATGTHVIAVENGIFYDAWNSSEETPIYFFYRKEN